MSLDDPFFKPFWEQRKHLKENAYRMPFWEQDSILFSLPKFERKNAIEDCEPFIPEFVKRKYRTE